MAKDGTSNEVVTTLDNMSNNAYDTQVEVRGLAQSNVMELCMC